MPTPASKPGRVTWVLLCLLALGVVLFFLLRNSPGLHPGDHPVLRKNMSRLVMTNESACEWRIVATSAEDDEREPQQWKISTGQSVEAVLRAGEYSIGQTLLASESGPAQTRRLSWQLEPGENYRWRLFTLLSGDERDVRLPVEGMGGHE